MGVPPTSHSPRRRALKALMARLRPLVRPERDQRASVSAAPVIRAHRQFGLGVRRGLWRDREELAAAVLNRGILELVVLTLVVELDAGTNAHIVGDVGGA